MTPVLVAAVLAYVGCAAPAADNPAAAPFVAMNLAAHPDDEDGATMHYYRRARDYHVYSVIFTRGEGGQNEIGPELYEALGALRSEETERAARHLGTQVHFLNFYDFGYSKSAEETFEVWGGRDTVIAELVHLIRRLRPDVIFTNHDTVTVGAGRQHGHHQAVGIAAYEAFSLSADPDYHKEQLAVPGVTAWQPQRLFVRHWGRPESYDVAVPVGDLDPDTGISFAAGAAHAIGFHASQGMGQFARRVAELEFNYFSVLRAVDSVPEGKDLFAGLAPRAAPSPHLTYLIDAGRVRVLEHEAVTVSDTLVVPGQEISVAWEGSAQHRVELAGALDTVVMPGRHTIRIPADAQVTRPAKVYQYSRQRNHPPILYAVYEGGASTVSYAGYLPVELAPAVYLEPVSPVVRLRPGLNRMPIHISVYDAGWSSVTVDVSVVLEGAMVPLFEGTQELPSRGGSPAFLDIMLPEVLPDGEYAISVAGPAGSGFQVVGRAFEAQAAAGLRVGVVSSYDDTLPEALTALGVDFTMLDSAALASADFAGLHTIVLDIRSYLVRSDLRENNGALLAWVRSGGHLVVNYHKTFEWNSRDGSSLAPLPITLGRSRVTREDAPVRVISEDHTLLRWPNPVGPEAWNGWVQERGLYFPESWDEGYEELFCMNDPGEAPHCGSTLLASVGQGTYLYTALVWYRQLKVHHPGAFALFANIISYPLAGKSPEQE